MSLDWHDGLASVSFLVSINSMSFHVLPAGLAPITGAVAVELLATLLQHPLQSAAPPPSQQAASGDTGGLVASRAGLAGQDRWGRSEDMNAQEGLLRWKSILTASGVPGCH